MGSSEGEAGSNFIHTITFELGGLLQLTHRLPQKPEFGTSFILFINSPQAVEFLLEFRTSTPNFYGCNY